MSESRFTIRLCEEIATEQQLISYLHSIPKSRRAEHIRLLLMAGYNVIVSGSQALRAPTSIPAATPVNQPLASQETGSAVHTEVTTSPQALPVDPPSVQEADPTPAPSFLDHEHEEEKAPIDNNKNELDSGMDAADPLSKMKNKFKGKGVPA